MNCRQQLGSFLRVAFMACSLSWGVAHAATDAATGAAQATESAASTWTAGEVRKLDKEAGKLTIRHEDIQNLNMPAMTMVFTVKNKSLLEGLKVGDKIKFMAVQEQGKLMVTDIQSAPAAGKEGMKQEGMKHGQKMKMNPEMMAKMEKHIEHMREMVQKWDAAQTPEARQALMEDHHRMMHEGMEMSPKKGDDKHH